MSEALPVISVRENTFPAAVKVREVKAPILSDDEEKVNVAIDAFEQAVPTEQFIRELLRRRPGILPPRMFEHRLVEWARGDPKHIVLPEGEDERILRAAGLAPRKGIARLTLLRDPETIAKKGRPLGLDLSRLRWSIPHDSQSSNGMQSGTTNSVDTRGLPTRWPWTSRPIAIAWGP